jgi:hypothetical protein
MVVDNAIAFTVDVEWAHSEVLADVVRLFDDHGVKATFFCTHPGPIPGHERGLHPNYRRNGDTVRKFFATRSDERKEYTDDELSRFVLSKTKEFAPEAVGVRSHSLYYDSSLLPIYAELGLQYDSSYFLPLEPALRPVQKEFGVLELPIFYMDHHDLVARASDFRIDSLGLDTPGLKVFDFHPNLVFINARDNEQYLRSKPSYKDPDALRALRERRRGVRSLFVDLLAYAAKRPERRSTLGAINTLWRARHAT